MDLLLQNGWCRILLPLLQADDYDTKEKVLQAILVSVDACKNEYQNQIDGVMTLLKKQVDCLEEDISKEEDDDFKSYLVNLKEQLNNDIIKKIV